MKAFSIIVLVLLGLIIVFLSTYLIVMRIFFHYSLARKKTSRRLENKKLLDDFKIDTGWWDKHKFEDMMIVSEDGLKLYAHYLNNSSDKTAIIVHGYRCSYKEMSNYAKMFLDMGYNILVTENRAHGKSEGNIIGMGWLDKQDIVSWVNVLVEKNEKVKIALFGLSMGGATVLMTLGEDLPQNVVCAISDCAYENVYNQMEHVFNPNHKKIRRKFMAYYSNYIKRAYDFDLRRADAGLTLKKSKIPVMLIHGKEDTFVPINNLNKLSEKLPSFRLDTYVAKDAGHAMSYVVDPRKYQTRVREFLKKWGM